MVDYLESRAASDKGMARSVPDSIAATLAVLESAGQVSEENSISMDSFWKSTVAAWKTALESGAPPKVQAEATPVSVIIATELFVMDTLEPRFLRAIAWLYLVMHWATLRIDDVANIDPARLTLSEVCLKGILTKTKTTGPGRRTREVPFFVSRSCSFAGCDWIQAGFDVWSSEEYSFHRDFFVMKSSRRFDAPLKKPMLGDALVAHIRQVLSRLRVLTRPTATEGWRMLKESRPLVHTAFSTWFKGHGPRHWLPSVAAVLGAPKADRDVLGRWAVDAHQSNDYVLTARLIVLRTQAHVVRMLSAPPHSSEGEANDFNYDEVELLEKLQAWAAGCGLEPDSVEGFKSLIKSSQGKWSLMQQGPQTAPLDDEGNICFDEEADAELPVAAHPERERKMVEQASPFWVSVARSSGFRRLHRTGCCPIRRENCWGSMSVYEIKPGIADAACKDCQRKGAMTAEPTEDSSSSSGSSSSDEDEQVGITDGQVSAPPPNAAEGTSSGSTTVMMN
ncbi:unnamed protein product [Polarella glacialis]|uniref:Uncharacterized protein n=1 Tax=Polarella glacialis TaxID=89957 RepID=A0A813D7R5_POLGL|nr:unnamed protein product [Polarella glacialis]